MAMDKYGVNEKQGDLEGNAKQANAGCPECGSPLEKHGQVLQCPVHGTQPFEEKDDNPWHPKK